MKRGDVGAVSSSRVAIRRYWDKRLISWQGWKGLDYGSLNPPYCFVNGIILSYECLLLAPLISKLGLLNAICSLCVTASSSMYPLSCYPFSYVSMLSRAQSTRSKYTSGTPHNIILSILEKSLWCPLHWLTFI